jgi:putative endonuclease
VPASAHSEGSAEVADELEASAVEHELAPAQWCLYLLRSASGRTYVGISVDVERRLAQHNGELPGGAKSTRAGRPWALVARWGPYDRSRASALEYQLKRRPGSRRASWQPDE